MGEWISVNDRLPDKDDYEIIVCDGGYVYASYYNSDDGFYYIEDGYLTRLSGITHWMPLPKPPEVE